MDTKKRNADALRASKEWRAGIGAGLRAARASKGLTQQVLADLAGVDISTVSTIERGVVPPRLETIWTFADLLGVSLDQIVGRMTPDATLPVGDAARPDRPLSEKQAEALRLATVGGEALVAIVQELRERVGALEAKPQPQRKRA